MSGLRIVCVVLALGAASAVSAVSPAVAQPASQGAAPAVFQPPMNDFNQAFYRCDAGGAFMMSYNADNPAKAEMAANDGAKPHELKRVPSKDGAEYAGGGVRFWTDGKSVVVDDAKAAFKNCKMKAG
jgi:membrane-bound inhibitor of C-type lysozyme